MGPIVRRPSASFRGVIREEPSEFLKGRPIMKTRESVYEGVRGTVQTASTRWATRMTSDSRPKAKMDDTVTVKLDDRSYDILVSYGGISALGSILREKGIGDQDVFVFTSPRIGKHHFRKLEQSLTSAGFRKVLRHDIPDGEKNKNEKQFQKCIGELIQAFQDPQNIPLVVNLGGGVVGDIGGFVAGTFHRGVPYVQVPTTVLGCVDCGVGGKVGVNQGGVKNVLGVFHQPSLVFADLELLQTLDPREIRSGIAEVIKYGAVCDATFFEYLEKEIERLVALEKEVLTHVVGKCFRLKAGIVEQDERDILNKRIVLNFGHTVGHALEMSAKASITHGEGISIGMVAATRLAVEFGACGNDVLKRIRTLLQRAGLPTSASKYKIDFDKALYSIRRDKKSLAGNIRFIFPTAIGAWKIQEIADQKIIRRTLRASLKD